MPLLIPTTFRTGPNPSFVHTNPITPGPRPGELPFNPRRISSGVPPLGETRFIQNEVLLQAENTITLAQITQVTQPLGLTLISTQPLSLLGRTLYRFGFPAGDIRAIIQTLESNGIMAQPNYLFSLARDLTIAGAPNLKVAQNTPEGGLAPNAPLPGGDPAQYVIAKLHLVAAHRLATGRNVSIAVIDSEIDDGSPDLRGAVRERYDATATPSSPQTHGTNMAGAIAARGRLLGIAPAASIIGIKAFVEGTTGVNGSSEQILKGLDHAASTGARIINMSFAGPRDPMLERLLTAAYDRNLVLIAAAGNGGPRAAPLFPGADPHVMAVTASDSKDRPFAGANRGKYIALAAPGVDVLVPSVGDNYGLTTGTSVAAANVSGVVALLLERWPTLTPTQVRTALTRTAKIILSNDQNFQTGAGLVDPVAAFEYLTRTADGSAFGTALAYAPSPASNNPLARPYYKESIYRAPPIQPPTWSFWTKGIGDWERRGALNATDLPRSLNTYGINSGVDRRWWDVFALGDSFVTGVFGSWMQTSAVFSTTPAHVQLNGPGVGAYAMWAWGGFSTDVIGKGDFFDLAEGFEGTAPNANLRVRVPGVAENINYKFRLGQFSFVEPTMGYMLTRTLFDGSAAANGLQDATTLRVQGGLRFGAVIDLNGAFLVPSLAALIYENAIAQGTAINTNPGLPLTPTDAGQIRGEIIPKLNFYFGGGYAAFLEGGVRFGHDLVGGAARIGLQKQW
jgi:Subtilase family/Autotransporter beta-domain